MRQALVTFLEQPALGRCVRFIANGRSVTSSPVVSVEDDPAYPGRFVVTTSSGSVYIGMLGVTQPQPNVTMYGSPSAGQWQQPYVYAPPAPRRSKLAAGLFGIFLGGLGIHKFYLGQWVWGIIYIVFVWTYVPAIVGLIEGIVYLCMSDEEFAMRYG